MDNEAALFFFNELNSEDSSSEDEMLHARILRGPMVLRPRITRFIENVVDEYSEELFRENFRVYRRTFNAILDLIRDDIATRIIDRGRHTISAKKQLLLALWYLATPDSYRSVCGRFNVGYATGLRTVRRVTNALLAHSPDIIVWPTGDYKQEVVQGFQEKGFPNTIGSIDGMFVKIPKPKHHGISYINRKGFPSIILQGVCDHNLKFTNCYVGEVGSNHDATVLRRSEVWSFMLSPEKFENNVHLIGDKAYPCLPELMTPYRDNGLLTEEQRNYNYFLSSARSTIERCFGMLQARFRCLKDLLPITKIDWGCKYIMACCILHNICITQNNIIRRLERHRIILGQRKRNEICEQINN